jgi:CheY-like chemotaxis protein/CheY-specific phosphatase CheX
MENPRFVIVDDSAFSIMYIKNILESNGYAVVGEAGTLEEVIRVVKEQRPDVVTMDITLPGTDGLECTRAIHAIDENIKVIVISSMMDDEIVNKAKKNKVSAYIQKPFDGEELLMVIQRLTAAEALFKTLQEEYFTVFKDSLLNGLNRMTKTILTYSDEYTCCKDYQSTGISVIVGIIGKFSGRMLIDVSRDTALKIAASVYKREPKDNDELMSVLSEFANIIAGNACSALNKINKALGLRVAPPSILTGDDVHILAPSFSTMTAVGKSDFGELLLNVGFSKEGSEWTQNT